MKLDEVPQDGSSTYAGHRKVIYAVDDSGHYRKAQSDGWEAESFSTRLAVAELEELEAQARLDWLAGRASPLKCLMYRYRFDETALAQATGLWRWRLRRHLCPPVYRKLSRAMLARYAEAFGCDVEELIRYQKELPL